MFIHLDMSGGGQKVNINMFTLIIGFHDTERFNEHYLLNCSVIIHILAYIALGKTYRLYILTNNAIVIDQIQYKSHSYLCLKHTK